MGILILNCAPIVEPLYETVLGLVAEPKQRRRCQQEEATALATDFPTWHACILIWILNWILNWILIWILIWMHIEWFEMWSEDIFDQRGRLRRLLSSMPTFNRPHILILNTTLNTNNLAHLTNDMNRESCRGRLIPWMLIKILHMSALNLLRGGIWWARAIALTPLLEVHVHILPDPRERLADGPYKRLTQVALLDRALLWGEFEKHK